MKPFKKPLKIIHFLGVISLLGSFIASNALAQQMVKPAPQFNVKPNHSVQPQTVIDQKAKTQRIQILRALEPANDIAPSMQKLRAILNQMESQQRAKNTDSKTFKRLANEAKREINQLKMTTSRLDQGFTKAAEVVPTQRAKAAIKKFKYHLNKMSRKLENEDKLENLEIQDLMSTFNQAQATATNVEKKKDDTESAILAKI